MKAVVKPSLVKMDADDLKSLLTEVKETVAMGFNMPQKKVFSINNMWNIRRNVKSASSMIRIIR